MSEQIFPSWWGPKGGDPVQCRSAREVQEGWVRHHGHYDVQIGQWVKRDPLDHDGDGAKGGSTRPSGDGIKALRAAYKTKFGKKPFGGWDEATLRARLERAR
jgi:hypothetical protein